ncbi:uncharacterized protein LOC118817101 [Colossoma macropomum]|uniref:uncharacterized protein LOC118817101 n=1 Tax=Colossoma macropomum TaxID=42526 RepID=UPI0018641AB6|nr:uncharacterized protein LOC118817101 [Colossoma macropomum]
MERSRAVLITLSCVLFSRISGEEVEIRVRPGDNVTLYSDCFWKHGFETVWFKNSSHEHMVLKQHANPRYSIVSNVCKQTSDLLVKNVSESDLGLYYCAVQKKSSAKDKTRACSWEEVCHFGTRTTRLSFLDTTLQTTPTPTPPLSDCSVCWKLLVSVCPVCVLLSFSFVYCIYRYINKVTVEKKDDMGERKKTTSRKNDKVGKDEVCYASLDLPSRGQKRMKKRVESSDFCTYSEVNTNKI